MRYLAFAFVVLATPAFAEKASVAATDGTGGIGTVPCSAKGTPMQSCKAELRRSDNGKATLAVLISGGDVRRIYSENGKPVSTSSTSKMTWEQIGDILRVFVAPNETYELPAAAVQPQ